MCPWSFATSPLYAKCSGSSSRAWRWLGPGAKRQESVIGKIVFFLWVGFTLMAEDFLLL